MKSSDIRIAVFSFSLIIDNYDSQKNTLFVSNLSRIDNITEETLRPIGTPLPKIYLAVSSNNYFIEGVAFTASEIPSLFNKPFKSSIFFQFSFRVEFFTNDISV